VAITEATKVADSIRYIEDGKVKVKTITGTHIVISFPIENYNEVLNVYVDPDTEILTVAYDGGSFTLDPSATGVSDHGGLTGLTDDDHTQYVLATGARAMGELRLTPKSSSSGPEGTVFYDSDDDHIYVGTE